MFAALALAAQTAASVQIFATPQSAWPRSFEVELDMKAEAKFSLVGATAQFEVLRDGHRVGPEQKVAALKVDASREVPGEIRQVHLTTPLDRAQIPSGLYTLSGSVTSQFRQGQRTWRQSKRISPVRLYLPPMGEVSTSRFFAESSYFGSPALDGDGKTISPKELIMRPWTLLHREGKGAWFDVEGQPGPVHLADATYLGLQPVIEDIEIKALRRRFRGKRVWMYGGTWAFGMGEEPDYHSIWRAPLNLPARVREIYRLRQTGTLSLGDPENRDSSFLCVDPIVVVLDLPKEASLTSGWMDFHALGDASLAREPSMYSAYSFMVSGAWDLERTIADASPLGASWRGVQDAILARKPRVGMSPDQLAWTMGWPPSFASPEALRRQQVWRYPQADMIRTFKFSPYGTGKPVTLVEMSSRKW